MKYIKLALLIALTVALVGCGDDDYNGGGGSGEDGYGTYWGIIETISVEGDVTNMTQKPEAPAPRGDQEECPGMIAIASLFISLSFTMYMFRRDRSRRIVTLPIYLKRNRNRRPRSDNSERLIIASLPPTIP